MDNILEMIIYNKLNSIDCALQEISNQLLKIQNKLNNNLDSDSEEFKSGDYVEILDSDDDHFKDSVIGYKGHIVTVNCTCPFIVRIFRDGAWYDVIANKVRKIKEGE